ncbi:MAG: AmmeMemoRadiSam system protein A [FCB group bacterium]|nr:AmmeMemoRadiSam system protein A [FCB group bacterium]
MIKETQKKEMLGAVRGYLEHRLMGEEHPELSEDPFYREKRGIFVTLHKKGQLRGCIGYIEGVRPLEKALFEMAESAAFRDPRFPPLAAGELKDIDIEISVLTPVEEIASYKDIVLGKHGIILRKGHRSAVFLPQVAPEQGWDIKTTLRHLCMKAGLPVNAYLDADTEFHVFSAEVFSESP